MSVYCGPQDIQIVTDGAIVLLDSNEKESYPGYGLTYFNMSGNGKHGTLANEEMMTEIPGIVRLNNTTDKMNFGYDEIFTPESVTICFWANLIYRGDRHILITKWNGWSFEISSGKLPYLRTTVLAPQDLYTTAISWNVWWFVAGVVDTTINSKRVFLNGVLNNSVTSSGAISYNTGTFNIPYNNSATNAWGWLGPVQIYDRGLSDEEVMQNFNANKKRFGFN